MAVVAASTIVAAATLTACTSGSDSAGSQSALPSPTRSPTPSAQASQATPEGDATATPTPSATSMGVLPALSSGQPSDLLLGTADARRIVGRKFQMQDTSTGTVLYPGDRTIKPSKCLNADAIIDIGAPASPTIGSTSTVSLSARPGFVYQTITPSDQATSVLEYFLAQAAGPCKTYTSARPASLIINNGPSKDIDVLKLAKPRTFDAMGTRITAFPTTLTYRTSADVTYGRPASVAKSWLLISAAGNNLVTTLAGGISGGEALSAHKLTVERVVEAAEEYAATGGMAETAEFTPTGRDSADSTASAPASDDPTWPIDAIAQEVRAQWQGERPSLGQVRNMALLVCRKMRDITWDNPNHSTMMQNLQGRIVDRWNLNRITGPWDAWNLITTAEARCKGATVITQMN